MSKTIDNNYENNSKENNVKKNHMLKKSFIFRDERSKIIKIFDDLLHLTEYNRFVLISDISEQTQKKIIELSSDVRKFFRCSGWKYFKDDSNHHYLDLVKSVYRSENYTIDTYTLKKKINDKLISYSALRISK